MMELVKERRCGFKCGVEKAKRMGRMEERSFTAEAVSIVSWTSAQTNAVRHSSELSSRDVTLSLLISAP